MSKRLENQSDLRAWFYTYGPGAKSTTTSQRDVSAGGGVSITAIIRFVIVAIPVMWIGSLGDVLPMWREIAPSLFHAGIGATLFNVFAVGASLVGAGIYYFIYRRFLRSNFALWIILILIVILGLVLG